VTRGALSGSRTLAGLLAGGLALGLGLGACGTVVPKSHQDPANPEARGDTGLPVLSLAWRFAVGNHADESGPQEFASPAVYDDYLFIGSVKGQFYALAEKDGKARWRSRIGAVSSQPLVDRGLLYIGTDDGSLVCVDMTDGKEKWRYTTRGSVLEPPVLADGMIFFSNEADQIYALDADSGKFRWQYKSETPEEYTLRGHAGTAVDGGLVFTGFSNGTMVALRAATGSVAWMTSLKGDADKFVDVDGTPIIDGDSLYVTASAGGVYALDKTTGLVRWRHDIDGAASVAVDGDRIYVAAAEEGIHALDRNGNILWRQGTRGGGEPAQLLVSGDYLIYALSDAGMFVTSKRTGELYQYFDPGDGISATPTLVDDRLYVLSNRGILYALNLHTF
jgi:outer membrane protein assembly factor BamB